MLIKNHHVPKFLIGDSIKFCWYCKIIGKTETHQKYVHILTLKAVGDIKGD
jgi:hypothetical protein